ncbi:MAG: hypothetical protein IIV54_00770 [Bacteroidaceae bacterium]|nr:hypothetical protein [Bacteroidaceae bacterium]
MSTTIHQTKSYLYLPDSNNWDYSVFDRDRFENNGSGNWVDWEDVSTGNTETDGFEHPGFDENGEW